MVHRLWVLVFVTVLTLAPFAAESVSLHQQIASHVKANEAAWIELRRDLHRHPEVSGQEQRTAGVVTSRL